MRGTALLIILVMTSLTMVLPQGFIYAVTDKVILRIEGMT